MARSFIMFILIHDGFVIIPKQAQSREEHGGSCWRKRVVKLFCSIESIFEKNPLGRGDSIHYSISL